VLAVDNLVRNNPALAREIGRAIDARRQRITEALRAVDISERPVPVIVGSRMPAKAR
jgi:hypothetical protein